MLAFFAFGNAKVVYFALGDAKVPNASSFAWNIGLRVNNFAFVSTFYFMEAIKVDISFETMISSKL